MIFIVMWLWAEFIIVPWNLHKHFGKLYCTEILVEQRFDAQMLRLLNFLDILLFDSLNAYNTWFIPFEMFYRCIVMNCLRPWPITFATDVNKAGHVENALVSFNIYIHFTGFIWWIVSVERTHWICDIIMNWVCL